LNLYPTSHPAGGLKVLQKAWNPLSDDVKAILQSAESNLNALKQRTRVQTKTDESV
jgi:hypothetical protein